MWQRTIPFLCVISLRTPYLDGRHSRGLGAAKLKGVTHRLNRTLHGSPLECAGENNIARAAFDRDVDGEAEFVAADPAAEHAAGAVIAGDAAGQGAVGLHGEIGGGFFLALRR